MALCLLGRLEGWWVFALNLLDHRYTGEITTPMILLMALGTVTPGATSHSVRGYSRQQRAKVGLSLNDEASFQRLI